MEELHSNHSLTDRNRQSPIAIFLIIQGLFSQLLRQFWPILIVILLNQFNFQASNNESVEDSYLARIIFVMAAISTVGSIIAYFKFYFYIENDEFVIEKGIFKKTKINIPFDRIQTINFEQNVIHQIFNVVRLEVDSAGTNTKEISLQAISKQKAEAIRSYIMTEKAKAQPLESEALSIDEETGAITTEVPQELLMQLSPLDLLKVGISQNHIRGLGVIFGFAFWIFQTADSVNIDPDKIGVDIDDLQTEDYLWIVPFMITLLIIASIIISLFLTVLRHFDLRFFRNKSGFKVVSGLFTKREESANFNKIQLIRWADSVLKRLFGIFRLHLFQASSAAVNIRQSINVPGCYLPQVNTVRATYFPNEQEYPYESHGISPLMIGRRVLYLGGIPAILFALNAYFENSIPFAIGGVLWILFVYVTSRAIHKNWKFHISKEGLLTENGILGTEFTLLKWYKIQAVRTSQSIYQRRKDVANLYFYTAAGTVKIPYVDLDTAQEIMDYVLYKIEADNRAWM